MRYINESYLKTTSKQDVIQSGEIVYQYYLDLCLNQNSRNDEEETSKIYDELSYLLETDGNQKDDDIILNFIEQLKEMSSEVKFNSDTFMLVFNDLMKQFGFPYDLLLNKYDMQLIRKKH